ncbi:MAG: hypothetical protein IPI97_01500 [Nitrosomonas sp.]|nr:hypothetical protein [Nitrosomonas sp.]MBK7363727.1 hypothetical protein [Nitrosomonas sp.]
MPETASGVAYTILDLFLLQLAIPAITLAVWNRLPAQKGVQLISEVGFSGIIISIFGCLFMA